MNILCKHDFKLLYILLLVFLVSSCSSRYSSFLMIGEDYDFTVKAYSELMLVNKNSLSLRKDTIQYKYYLGNSPFQTVMLFKDDKCYYQELNIYCSPCADVLLEDIINDGRYKFEALDALNYKATKSETQIILRLSNKNTDDVSCSNIKVNAIDKPK